LLQKAKPEFKTWKLIIQKIRTRPILQVMREIYKFFQPWCNYSDDSWKRQYYRLNVDLLFEQLIESCDIDGLTINTLAEYLNNCIETKISVDSRIPPSDTEKTAIQCITVHKAKGLEYGHVIVPFASFNIDSIKKDHLYVSTSKISEQPKIGYSVHIGEGEDRIENEYYNEEIEKSERSREETRILYVAMTRSIRSFSWIVHTGKTSGLSWQSLIKMEKLE
jgi:DNA helicase II / ATP-dependent DNA helicase PcrA